MEKKSSDDAFLTRAHRAFAQGDVVASRRYARSALAAANSTAEKTAARRIAKELWPATTQASESPEAVATELMRRTGVPPPVYAYAAVAAAIFAALVTLAATRGAWGG